jgi:hypothetical protein
MGGRAAAWLAWSLVVLSVVLLVGGLSFALMTRSSIPERPYDGLVTLSVLALAFSVVGATDLMPTFLELAGAPIPEYVDGRSLVPVLSGSDPSWRDSLLLEGYDDGFGKKAYVPPDFEAIRTSEGRTYVEYETGEREMYDLRTDPRQLRSEHDEPERAVEEAALSARLEIPKYCSGEACRSAEKPKYTASPPFSDAAFLMYGYTPSTRPGVISGETHPTRSIQRTSWKGTSANFTLTEFSEVRLTGAPS